jgi:hypothetical protein
MAIGLVTGQLIANSSCRDVMPSQMADASFSFNRRSLARILHRALDAETVYSKLQLIFARQFYRNK